VLVAGAADVLERAQGVEAREQRHGRRLPVASSHSDDGPGRIRMPWRAQMGFQLATPSV
jgi:hypothetical protein